MKKILAITAVLLLSACIGTTQPSTFYSLKSISRSEASALYKNKLSIGIEEVKVPNYLDKPQIVTHADNSVELKISELNRWSEPLSASIQRTIANDISVDMPNSLVKPRTYSRENFDYVVFVEIDRFDGSWNKNVVLDAWWSVMNKDNQIVIRERTQLTSKLGNSYDNLVTQQSHLIAQLSQQIAAKISQLK